MSRNFIKNLTLVFFILTLGLSICLAQSTDKNLGKNSLISKGDNNLSSGALNVTAYRLEKVALKKPLDLMDGKPPISFAFRLTISTDQDLPVTGFSIWLGDMQLNASAITPREVGTVIYRRSLPANIAIGLSKHGENDVSNRSILSETLEVPSEYATGPDETISQPIIQLRRTARTQSIQLTIAISDRPCVVGNNILVVEISGKEFSTGCEGDAISRTFTNAEFASLSNGSEIALKFGGGRNASNRRVVGRLDKTSIQ